MQQMTSAATSLRAALVDNQILKDELQALGISQGWHDNGRR